MMKKESGGFVVSGSGGIGGGSGSGGGGGENIRSPGTRSRPRTMMSLVSILFGTLMADLVEQLVEDVDIAGVL